MAAIRILIATKNLHKAKELKNLLNSLGDFNSDKKAWSLKGIDLKEWENSEHVLEEAVEDSDNFKGNALIKAIFYAKASGLPALADDSGLSIIALGGAPGVKSARFGGPGLNDNQRCDLLLEQLAGEKDRRAFFTTALALAKANGEALVWEGHVHGSISERKAGEGGFGYDPIFYYPPAQKTFAELRAEEKNKFSHRAAATKNFFDDGEIILNFLRSQS